MIRGLMILLLFVMPLAGQAQERIELADGARLSVFIVRPDRPPPAQGYPLVILMGGGSGNAAIARDTAQWLGTGFAARGWLVAVPVSPSNRSFRGSLGNKRISQLADALLHNDDVATGKPLLAGISNGGMSALEIARREPERFLGVVAVPAVVSADSDNSALAGFPVYLRIGSADQLGWGARYDETVARLEEAGVKLDAELLYGAPHMFGMDWTTLEPWLQQLSGRGAL